MQKNDENIFRFIKLDIGRTFGFAVDQKLDYSNIVSGEESFTMLVHLKGDMDAHTVTAFISFKNSDCEYPIIYVSNVKNRTGKKGWMDRSVMSAWSFENLVIYVFLNCCLILFLHTRNKHVHCSVCC